MDAPLPVSAAWRHLDARAGFEVLFCEPHAGGRRFRGFTSAVEDGVAWSVAYVIDVDAAWRTRAARITGRTHAGERTRTLDADGAGHWHVDGEPAPAVDGCLDADLEASAFTNA